VEQLGWWVHGACFTKQAGAVEAAAVETAKVEAAKVEVAEVEVAEVEAAPNGPNHGTAIVGKLEMCGWR
jgi:hypothetical protein